MRPLTLSNFDSPVGNIIIGGHNNKVYFVKIGTFEARDEWLEKWRKKNQVDEPKYQEDAFSNVKEEFHRYFKGDLNKFTFEYELLGTDFQQQVWHALIGIPYGEQWTYKNIAESIGNVKAIRAVGGAINKNPISIAVPCHRVIGSDGSLTGYASGLDHKRFLLHLETDSKHWLHQTS
ncbi:methylated-DNA--[protein]-cysteine S-methyltransferase [Piscibacillus sp. B03]|uniref:methylated-DNA--[protein]-cysteine S-methyltransferase n=1 Tax=Piscibacillus sp. B03 TaxID=3457430 RepID=UPI003FCE52DE